MARMIPAQCPPDTNSQAEATLFRAFQQRLPDPWTVVHSLPWLDEKGPSLQEGECDFLCFHPGRGLLAVEAKTGVKEYKGREKAWYQETDGRRRKLPKDPFLQAQESVRALVKRLDEAFGGKGNFPLPFGHAVAFPDSTGILGALPPHAPPDIWITAGDVGPIGERVEFILGKYARGPARPLSAEGERLVWDALAPAFRLVRALGPMVENQERELFRLTREQWERLRDLDGNRRLVVEGVAGSGKTVLAVQKAASLADDGARVLLLCFNRALAEHLSREPALKNGGVKVANFHALCGEWAKAAAVPFEVPKEGEAVREFWETEAAGLLAQAIARKPGDYDALIVDEAQDFRPAWWPPVVSTLADPEEGHFYVFTDPDQNIFESKAKLPFKGPVKRLRFNCRNTHAIAERLHELIRKPMETPPFAVDGPPVEERECASDAEERRVLEDLVRGLTGAQGLRPEQIVLLSPHTLEHSSLAGLKKLCGFPLARTVSEPVPGEIRFATIGGFKGLESDCVIVFGVREGDDKAEPRDLYVGCSRAKHVLKVVRRSDKDEGS